MDDCHVVISALLSAYLVLSHHSLNFLVYYSVNKKYITPFKYLIGPWNNAAVISLRERKVGFPLENSKFLGDFIGYDFLREFIATNIGIAHMHMMNT